MQPLSTLKFILRNKIRIISGLTIIIVTICLVYGMECFIESIVESIYPVDSNRFRHASVLVSTEEVPVIPPQMIDTLEQSENIRGTLPITIRQIVFSVPGSTTHTAVISTVEKDRDILIGEFNIKLLKGRFPAIGANEITLDFNVAKNNGLVLGDHTKIDTSHNMDRAYRVVGFLESDSYISIVGDPSPDDSGLKWDEQGYLVFPYRQRFEQAEDEVESLRQLGVKVWTLKLYERLYATNKQTFQILDAIVVLSIIVMVVCLVCSKYAQFFSRRYELGLLNALGYTAKDIAMRSIHEIVITNLLGLILGLIIAVFLTKGIVTNLFTAVGGVGVYLSLKAAGISLLAPLLTAVFTLIPVLRLIGREDAITIIQSK